jgi:hypothetical protein
MGFKNYVCVTCAQDFTRKYSAYRHNRILHQERCRIVRTLEYIIGRVTGEYPPADPILFRKNRQRTAKGSPGNFPFISIAHSSPDAQSYENKGQKEYKSSNQSHDESAKTYSSDQPKDSSSSKLEEIKFLCKSLFPHPIHDMVLRNIEIDIIKSKDKESRLDYYLQRLRLSEEPLRVQTNSKSFTNPAKEKGFLSPHPELFDLPQAARDKLIEIEQIISTSNHPATVWEEIKRLGNDFRITRNFNILNVALEFYKSNGWGYGSFSTA